MDTILNKMDTRTTRRQYKNTGMSLPLLGFGMMRLPQKDDKIDEETARSMVDRAMAAGVNYFDTAWMYHDGESENFVGKALAKYPRESYYVTSKMPIHILTGTDEAENIFQEQLRKTQAGYFDFYFMHWLNAGHWEMAKKFKILDLMKRKQQEGKIRKLGFSFHGEPEVLESIAKAYPWDLVQIQLNYLDWDLCRSREQYEILTQMEIPVAVMEPLRGGTLVSLTPEATEIFKAADPNASIASWGLRYAASLPNVLIVLSGMSTPEQLEDNLKTFSPFKPLDDSERKTVSETLTAYRKSSAVPCTACRYCSPCPVGVDIPRNLAIYNQFKATDNLFFSKLIYDSLPEGIRASACISCGVCKPKCPQQINIPSEMKKITNEFK